MDKTISRYFIGKPRFSFHHNITNMPENPPVHMHTFYEIYYLISGDVTYYIEGQSYNIKSNDILIINNKELHKPVFETSRKYERIVIHFSREFILPFQTEEYDLLYFFDKKKLGHYNKVGAKDLYDYGIIDYYNMMEEHLKNNNPETNIMIKTLFIQMLVKLNSIFIENKDVALDSFKYDARIRTVLNYINGNLHKCITLDQLEDKFYINKYYLCHLFKKNTGFTIMEYISYKRIMKAKELVLKGVPVMELFHRVGFNDYSNFYKVFRKLVGSSPREYVKKIESS